MRKEFLETFSALAGLSLETKDNYLSSKIKAKNEQLLVAFLDLGGGSVVQYEENFKRLIILIKEIERLVEPLLDLRVVALSPALTAKKYLLIFQLSLFDERKSKKPILPILPKRVEMAKIKKIETDRNLEDMIMTLLRHHGKCQMREIAYALRNDFSARTVQRYLHQMIKSGQLTKEMTEGYPKYSINGLN